MNQKWVKNDKAWDWLEQNICMNDLQNDDIYMYCTVDTFKKSTIKEFYDLGGITITGIDECWTT